MIFSHDRIDFNADETPNYKIELELIDPYLDKLETFAIRFYLKPFDPDLDAVNWVNFSPPFKVNTKEDRQSVGESIALLSSVIWSCLNNGWRIKKLKFRRSIGDGMPPQLSFVANKGNYSQVYTMVADEFSGVSFTNKLGY